MTTVVNGNTVYATKTRDTKQYFIRETVVNENDVAGFDADETAGGSAAGIQAVDFNGTVVGGNDAGLVTGTYTASINLDGTVYPISVDVTTADTFTAVVTAINADLPATELAISGGNLVVTSPTTGLASYVMITDVDLFSGMSGFIQIEEAIDGGLLGQLKARTLGNGANAYNAYSTAQEVYDTADPATIIKSAYIRGDLNAVFADTEVEAELDALKVKVDALQTLAS